MHADDDVMHADDDVTYACWWCMFINVYTYMFVYGCNICMHDDHADADVIYANVCLCMDVIYACM